MKRLVLAGLVFFSLCLNGQSLFDEVALISNLKFLSSDDMEGRRVGTDGNARARKFIMDQFCELGLEPLSPKYLMPFEFTTKGEVYSGINVVGVIRSRTKSDKYIVISAHYDHEGVKGGKIYNGADDNASGVGALFSMIEYFTENRPKHNLIFVAFDAEESGLQGAKAFVENPPVELSKIAANINMDMVARADKKELVACGTHFYPQFKPLLDRVKHQDHIRLVYGHDDPSRFKGSNNWIASSDHGAFHGAGIPFIYFGVEDHKDYHKHTDEFHAIDPGTYIDCVKLITRSLIEVDTHLN